MIKTVMLTCFSVAVFALHTATAQTIVVKVKEATPVVNGGETHVLQMDEADNGTMSCIEKVFTTEKEALAALKEGNTAAGRVVLKTQLDAAKSAQLENGNGTVIPNFPYKIQYARYNGPKTKKARAFGEPIFGYSKF